MLTKEDLINLIKEFVAEYDDTGCDGCGVVSESFYEKALDYLDLKNHRDKES